MTWDGERLRQLRLSLGWSVCEISRLLAVTPDQVRSLEAGELSGSETLLERLDLLAKQAEVAADEMQQSSLAEEYLKDQTLSQCEKEELEKGIQEV